MLVTLLALVGCNQIIGLDEREYSATAGDGGVGVSTGALSCDAYCDEVLSLCTADKGVQQFVSKEACLGVCDKYPKEPTAKGNTLACRVEMLKNVKQTGEDQTYCAGAGPGGGASTGEEETAACGTNCEGFCALQRATCKPENIDANCERKCQALIDVGGFNADANFASGIDTLQCRIAHLSAAANFALQGKLDQRDAHCGHSGIRSETQCDFKGDREIDCESYCKVVGTACTGDNAVYESTEQCLKVCRKIPSGTSTAKTVPATRRCIREGAYDALIAGPSFCATASPAPDRCGQCESFCQLAEQACGPQFATVGRSECAKRCSDVGGGRNAPYSVTMEQAKGGRTIQCRLRQLTRALEGSNDAKTCEAVLGVPGADCT